MKVNFYRQKNCPLCDDALRMMKLVQEDFDFHWEEIDITSDDALHEKYMLQVPVIEKDGSVLLYGDIQYIDLVLLLENEK